MYSYLHFCILNRDVGTGWFFYPLDELLFSRVIKPSIVLSTTGAGMHLASGHSWWNTRRRFKLPEGEEKGLRRRGKGLGRREKRFRKEKKGLVRRGTRFRKEREKV